MSVNEQGRATAVASETEERARTLAHSTRTIEKPADSYALLGDLRATVDHLEQVAGQLAAWHDAAQEGTHHHGEDEPVGDEAAVQTAHDELARAATMLASASVAIDTAHSANARVRWVDEHVVLTPDSW